MNKNLLFISLFAVNLHALPETIPTDKKPFSFTDGGKRSLPASSKAAIIEELLKPKKVFINTCGYGFDKKGNKFLTGQTASIKKNYLRNEIIVQIKGVDDSWGPLTIANETGDLQEAHLLTIENKRKKIAELIIVNKEKGLSLFCINLTETPDESPVKEAVFGESSYSDDIQISYSKEDRTVTIVIPFNFARKTLPVEIKN
jgi:hypothetical protein